MNEGPYRGHCLSTEEEVSYAKQMQRISLKAQQEKAIRLEKNTKDHYERCVRIPIKDAAKRGKTSLTIEELFQGYSRSGIIACKDSLRSLLAHDGFALKDDNGAPDYTLVSWRCL